ncbi:hypothetical protein [Arthrobacter psychrochitiniphilus]|uniref:Uncharacterized protein n=1 Tax=Arthrobacter psychrochitiniphilus TaxID=291045 RepID=A0A2V3DQE5_9MICC|nr:hypothetical protein [Arthrobacter psychrochitiniphilus]NYG17745.1 hypothetical protein [Arthrobacter psychrochitiniphilus]PXA65200.1 hypothetical protein CVS29_11035 [Arthrobacter psychrochitiniphilus]
MIHQLKQAGTFTNIGKMEAVLTAVSTNIVVDKGLNLIELAQQATAITAGHISFTTLPITGFGTAPNGESINTVNVGQVQTTVKELLAPAPKAAATSGTSAADKAAAAKAAANTTATYSDWTGALQGGTIPCVK